MKYIAIEGRSGSGKTYLAELLAKQLQCRVLHLDHYGNDFEPFVGIPGLLAELSSIVGAEVVVYEGVGVFTSKFDHFQAFKIFVDTDEVLRQARATSRDVPSEDRSKEEWERIYKIWNRAESEYFTDEIKAKAHFLTRKDGALDIDDVLESYYKYYASW